MAHENMKIRRSTVFTLIENGYSFTASSISRIAQEFNCSASAIQADIDRFNRGHDGGRPTPAMKDKIKKRDKDCRYCGNNGDNMIVEHIIPWAKGGAATEGNLVLACQSCNTKKRPNTWIPNDFQLIPVADQKEILKKRLEELDICS